MNLKLSLLAGAVALGLTGVAIADHREVILSCQEHNSWFEQGADIVEHRPQSRSRKKAKNVILFVGDGMGVSTVTATIR